MTELGVLGGLEALWVVARILGFGVLAGVSAALVAFVYRTRIREELPEGAALIVGLGVVAISLNTRLVFAQFVGGDGNPLTATTALVNMAIFTAAGVAAFGGRSIGHRVASTERFAWTGRQPSLSPIVRATGRYIAVTLPDQIGDIEGYDPVSPEAKTALADRTFEFPQGLTVEELEAQLVTRLTEKHDVGYVDVDLTADGSVEYLAIGQRPAGLGPTLPAGTGAVALRADPPFSASPGDTVEIWLGGDPESIGVAELRASVGDVATVVADRALCDRIDPAVTYRLMTLPADTRPDREFAALLRRSKETMSTIQVGPESALVGVPLGALDVLVLALSRGEATTTIPDRDQVIAAEDRLVLLGRPDRLRKIESAGGIGVMDEMPVDVIRADRDGVSAREDGR